MEVVQNLSKMAQAKDTFVYDFVTSIKLCTTNLYSWCIDPLKRYEQPQFQTFNKLVHHICDALHMVWWMGLENQVEYYTFKFHTHLYMLHKENSTMNVMVMVTKDNWAITMQFAKYQCICATKGLIKELFKHFPPMN
jgi:hypothetical protein